MNRKLVEMGLLKAISVDGYQEHAGRCRKGNPCYKLTKKLVELCYCPSVLWEVGHVSDDIGCLAEEVPK